MGDGTGGTTTGRTGNGWTAALTVLAPISWGTTAVTVTELLPDGRPLLIATMRVVPAGILLAVAGTIAARWRPRGPEWRRIAALSLVNFGLFFPLLVVAVYRLPGGVAVAMGGLMPLLVATLSWLMARELPRRLDVAVGVVAALGVGLVVVRPGADVDAVGVLAALGANVSFAFGVVLTRLLAAGRSSTPAQQVAQTGWQLLLSSVVLVPLALVVEGTPPAPTGETVLGVAHLGLMGTGVAYVLWFNGVRRLPAAAPPLLGLAAPVTAATLGWAVLGEDLSPVQLLGFVLTIGAIAYGATLGASGPGPSTGPSPSPPRPDPRSAGTGAGTPGRSRSAAPSRSAGRPGTRPARRSPGWSADAPTAAGSPDPAAR